jgi:hypothetical protein
MRLYDLRREATMREARSWFISFFPESAEEVMRTMVDPTTSAHYRMVTTYWDMAACFINHGAIDEDMFTEITGEHIVVFAKVQPYLAELRKILQSETYLKNLETLIMKQPDAEAMLEGRRQMMKRWMNARAEITTSA